VSFCAANTRAGKTERMFDPPGFALLGSTRAFDALTFFAGLPKVQHRHSIVIADPHAGFCASSPSLRPLAPLVRALLRR
jgi:hypothetical protein